MHGRSAEKLTFFIYEGDLGDYNDVISESDFDKKKKPILFVDKLYKLFII